MHARTFRSTGNQRGYTLMEILVAVAIFATVMIVALLLYDQSNRVFKQANESAEMQQNTRVAYEKVVADLRMAGFDYKRAGTPTQGSPSAWQKDTDYSVGTMVIATPPDGHVYRCTKSGKSGNSQPAFKTGTGEVTKDNTVEWTESGAPVYEQPDEQIEYAHPNAITIRANYDYNDPTTDDHGREIELEKSSDYHFPVITTGNDEIVTYALVSRSGNASANKDTITFYADVTDGTKETRESYPGKNVEDKVEITGVDLTNLYPPYTLMRYTLGPDGKPKETALADNIRSMTFTYYQDSNARTKLADDLNVEITNYATLGGLGQYDPSKDDVIKERLIRGKIRAVTASIVGMSPQADFNYTHPSDTVAKNYRQYTLQSTIVGRNLGLEGVPQTDTNPPKPPILKNACTGYCGVALLSWSPAPEDESTLVTYTVLYDTSASGSFSNVLPAGTQTSYAVDLTQGSIDKTYYFRVAATNSAGTTLSQGSPLAITVKNATTPAAPVINSVTGATNSIEVLFTPPNANVGTNPSCSPSGDTDGFDFAPSEIKGYRIYRSKNSGFEPKDGEGTMVLEETSSEGLTSSGGGAFKFIDTDVVNCETYYYRIAAVEWCAAKASYNVSGDVGDAVSAYSTESTGVASTSAENPAKIENLKPHVDSVCDDGPSNKCNPVTLLWDKVDTDVKGNVITIDTYKISRQTRVGGVPIGAPAEYLLENASTTFPDTPQITWVDNDNLKESDPSTGLKYTYEYTIKATHCKDLDGDPATVIFPGACATGATIEADADGPGSGTAGDPLEGVRSLKVAEHKPKPITKVEVSIDGAAYSDLQSPYGMDWDIQDGDVHRISFRITAECTELITFYVRADAADCDLRANASQVLTDTKQVQLFMTNVGDAAVTLQDFDITWPGQTGLAWINVKLPSNATSAATTTGSETTSSARTVRFTPSTSTDQNIAVGATYKILLNFTGTGTASASGITIRPRWRVASDPTLLGCTPRTPTCSVSSAIAMTTDGNTANTATITITNSFDEPLDVSKVRITWAGMTGPATWDTVVIGGQTIAVGVTASGERTFTPTSFTIGAESTATIVMNFTKKKKTDSDVTASTIGDINLDYTTENSGATAAALTCRTR